MAVISQQLLRGGVSCALCVVNRALDVLRSRRTPSKLQVRLWDWLIPNDITHVLVYNRLTNTLLFIYIHRLTGQQQWELLKSQRIMHVENHFIDCGPSTCLLHFDFHMSPRPHCPAPVNYSFTKLFWRTTTSQDHCRVFCNLRAPLSPTLTTVAYGRLLAWRREKKMQKKSASSLIVSSY